MKNHHFQAHLGKISTFSKKCFRKILKRFATDQTADLSSLGYDRKILKVWSKSVPAFSKKCCRWLREIWMPWNLDEDKISKIMKNHEKMEKNEKIIFQKLFMVDLWVLGSRFQPFRNVSDHFWSTSGRFRLSMIHYKQILKKWTFWFFSSKISSLSRIPELAGWGGFSGLWEFQGGAVAKNL